MTDRLASVQAIRPQVARAAARWLTALLLDGSDERQVQACRRWREADPEHERAWQRATALQASLQRMPAALAQDTLQRHEDATNVAQARRRRTLRLFAGLLLAPPAAWTTWRWGTAMGDERFATGTGERRDTTLPDGSRLWLNARTELRVAFSAHERRIEIARGELLVQTAADPRRSFVVRTRSGQLRALGTRFLVRDLAGPVHLAVHEGAVEWTGATGRRTVVQAGEALDLADDGPSPVRTGSGDDTAWTRGILVARDLPLPDFAARLSVYRPGWLHCDPALHALRISGAFQLDQTDAILDALPRTLPVVRVVWRTRWWASIEPADDAPGT